MSALPPTLICRTAEGSRHLVTPPPAHILPPASIEAAQVWHPRCPVCHCPASSLQQRHACASSVQHVTPSLLPCAWWWRCALLGSVKKSCPASVTRSWCALAAVACVQGCAVALALGLGLRSIASVDGFVHADTGELIVRDVKPSPPLTDGSPLLQQVSADGWGRYAVLCWAVVGQAASSAASRRCAGPLVVVPASPYRYWLCARV